MFKYEVKFKSNKKYDPQVERITVIEAKDAMAAQSIFLKEFGKENTVSSCEKIEPIETVEPVETFTLN